MNKGTPTVIDDLRELVTLYCRGVDRRDIDLLRSIFHPDAELDFSVDYVAGSIDHWLGHVPQAPSGFGITQHHVTNSVFRVEGDVAEGETYVIAYHMLLLPAEGIYVAGARYLDRFERRNGT